MEWKWIKTLSSHSLPKPSIVSLPTWGRTNEREMDEKINCELATLTLIVLKNSNLPLTQPRSIFPLREYTGVICCLISFNSIHFDCSSKQGKQFVTFHPIISQIRRKYFTSIPLLTLSQKKPESKFGGGIYLHFLYGIIQRRLLLS